MRRETKQKMRLSQLQEDRILYEDIILRTMSSAIKYVYGEAGRYSKWDELKSGNVKGVYDLRKEFLQKLRYAISGYFDDFKKDHQKDDAEFNIIKRDELIKDLEELKHIIETEFPEYSEDSKYYQKFIDLIKGKKVTNLTSEEIYKYGKTTMPANLNENYMSHLGHELIASNQLAYKSEKMIIEEAENNNGRTKGI